MSFIFKFLTDHGFWRVGLFRRLKIFNKQCRPSSTVAERVSTRVRSRMTEREERTRPAKRPSRPIWDLGVHVLKNAGGKGQLHAAVCAGCVSAAAFESGSAFNLLGNFVHYWINSSVMCKRQSPSRRMKTTNQRTSNHEVFSVPIFIPAGDVRVDHGNAGGVAISCSVIEGSSCSRGKPFGVIVGTIQNAKFA